LDVGEAGVLDGKQKVDEEDDPGDDTQASQRHTRGFPIWNREKMRTKRTEKSVKGQVFFAVLWNLNYFLRFRFRFRLLKSYGSGSGSDF
jgi:hypothetical protein